MAERMRMVGYGAGGALIAGALGLVVYLVSEAALPEQQPLIPRSTTLSGTPSSTPTPSVSPSPSTSPSHDDDGDQRRRRRGSDDSGSDDSGSDDSGSDDSNDDDSSGKGSGDD